MTLDQLRIFTEVAERGHVTRAAKSLGMSQSAVSSAIAALEGAYEVRLFDRVGRGIRLTGNGVVFLREARAVLDRTALARAVLRDLAGQPGPVGIAASQTIATYWLPRRISAFQAANPRVQLNVVILNTHEVESAVAEGEVNIGLVEGLTQHPKLIRQRIDYDQMALVIASDQQHLFYKPAERENLKNAIRGINWVLREAGSGTRQGFEDLVASVGLSIEDLNVSLVLPSNEAVREAIEAGAGATVISRHVVASAIAAGNLAEIPINLPQREFALLRHGNRHVTAAQRALVEHLGAQMDHAQS